MYNKCIYILIYIYTHISYVHIYNISTNIYTKWWVLRMCTCSFVDTLRAAASLACHLLEDLFGIVHIKCGFAHGFDHYLLTLIIVFQPQSVAIHLQEKTLTCAITESSSQDVVVPQRKDIHVIHCFFFEGAHLHTFQGLSW